MSSDFIANWNSNQWMLNFFSIHMKWYWLKFSILSFFLPNIHEIANKCTQKAIFPFNRHFGDKSFELIKISYVSIKIVVVVIKVEMCWCASRCQKWKQMRFTIIIINEQKVEEIKTYKENKEV